MSKYLGNMNWVDAQKKISKANAVIVPLGSTEQHGYHLPLVTDNVVAEFMSKTISERADCVYLPVVNYGQVWSADGFPATISLSEATFISVVKDIVKALTKLGARNIILFSGHTGNNLPCQKAARELLDEYRIDNVYHISYFDVEKHAGDLFESELWNGKTFHAAEIETSIMLAINEDLVDMSQAIRDYPEVPKDYRFRPKHWKDFVNSGIFGDASLATTEKGVAFLKNWIDDIVMFIENEMQ